MAPCHGTFTISYFPKTVIVRHNLTCKNPQALNKKLKEIVANFKEIKVQANNNLYKIKKIPFPQKSPES